MTTLEERIAQAIAFTLAINTGLPDWMQTPALGRDMLPLGELAAPAVLAVVGEAQTREQWWICTNWLAAGGRKVLGPFESRELALTVRVYFEAHREGQGRTFWVDSEATS